MTKKQLYWTIGGTAVLLIAGIAAWCRPGGKNAPKPTFETAVVKRGNIHNAVTATGTIEPVTEVEVGTQVSGIVDRLYVDYNSVVKKGQLIAELDKTNLLNSLNQARMTVQTNQTEFDYQQKNYNRQKQLFEQGYISDKEYDEALYNYEKARNSLDISKIQLKTAETNLSYATIYSPIDGVVISKAVEEGQTVQAAMNTPTLYTIAADLTDMRVIADIDEADIGQVSEGLRVIYTVDAYPGVEFEGTVAQVRQEATTTSNVVTYEVVITAPNPELKLKPGMTASVSIRTMERNNVLLLPTKALQYVKQPVETGATTGTMTEIISGLAEGDTIRMEVIDNTDAPAMPSGAQSPFMPGPPGSKKK